MKSFTGNVTTQEMTETQLLLKHKAETITTQQAQTDFFVLKKNCTAAPPFRAELVLAAGLRI